MGGGNIGTGGGGHLVTRWGCDGCAMGLRWVCDGWREKGGTV